MIANKKFITNFIDLLYFYYHYITKETNPIQTQNVVNVKFESKIML